MKEVRILNDENWQMRHWKTITSCYNKSPWFEFYKDELDSLYQRRFEFLLDWNLACFKWVSDKLSITSSVSLSDCYVKHYDEKEYVDWRNRILPAGIHELDPEADRYPQVFEDRLGFIPNLSIIDRLFCVNY